MAQLVTLAHRVSSIHARYSKIHDSLFSVSLFKKIARRRAGVDSSYSAYESELQDMAENLAEIGSILSSGTPPQPNTTYSRKFSLTLEEYIKELSTSIIRLAEICNHRDRCERDEQPYNSEQRRVDLTNYDESIQLHKRLGIKLSQMVTRL